MSLPSELQTNQLSMTPFFFSWINKKMKKKVKNVELEYNH